MRQMKGLTSIDQIVREANSGTARIIGIYLDDG
jgi:hypothetical protein